MNYCDGCICYNFDFTDNSLSDNLNVNLTKFNLMLYFNILKIMIRIFRND